MYSSSKSDASEETVSECVFADTLQEQSQKKTEVFLWNQVVIESVRASRIVTGILKDTYTSIYVICKGIYPSPRRCKREINVT